MALMTINVLSELLGMPVDVTVCVPTYTVDDITAGRSREICRPGMKCQTLWLFHGGAGNHLDYVKNTNIVRYAEENKLAVVMPSDFNMGYTDHTKGGKYYTFHMEELPRILRSILPLSAKREDNFIGGLSGGSAMALKSAILYPENFSVALCMSGGGLPIPGQIPYKSTDDPAKRRKVGFPGPEIPADAEPFDLIEEVKKLQAEKREIPKLYLASGDRDWGFENLKFAYESLRELGVDCEFHSEEGFGHEWDFWELTLRKAFKNNWFPLRKGYSYIREVEER